MESGDEGKRRVKIIKKKSQDYIIKKESSKTSQQSMNNKKGHKKTTEKEKKVSVYKLHNYNLFVSLYLIYCCNKNVK